MIGKLGRLMLFVKNVRQTATFYIEKLSLTACEPFDDDGAELDAGGVILPLHKWDVSYRDAKIRPLTKLQFIVPDVAAAKATLEGKGVAMGEILSGARIRCEGTDPSGNIFVLVNR
jgi:hypothetical protein